ncbi:FAD-binding oxidoreductase [Thermoflexus sp.]|uniref:FAD-binding oxidoreductase n=1 Tax=Thermoflexus sp. TaxID=1969742 RepID=UPI0035E43C01
MRRWNGWGETTVEVPLPPAARRFLEERLGSGTRPRDCTLEEALATIPPSRLPPHPMVQTDSETRLRHTIGQGLPDWIAARSGRIYAPDGVAFPETNEEVRALLAYAEAVGARVVPYGGGTSVVGHLRVLPDPRPTLVVDLARMNRLLALDPISALATFQAGIRGPDLEAALRAHGFTLGHYPQSFEYSTLGGWIMTRSVGQFAMGYGRIEEMFVGGRLETPKGPMFLPAMPPSAAGPDLRHLVLGAEGRLGILTEATLRMRPLPEVEAFQTFFFPDFAHGVAAIREMAQAGLPLTMLRLSTAEETAITLRLAGREQLIRPLEGWLRLWGLPETRCMLLVAAAGTRRVVHAALAEVFHIAARYGGRSMGSRLAREWLRQRFRSPYLRNTLWELGYAVDTLETAVVWARVPRMVAALEEALRRGLEDLGERVYAFSHISHVYTHGANIYTTFMFRLAPDPDETLERWRHLKRAASEVIVRLRGTISHQHGVGVDHQPYLEAEKGALGLEILRAAFRVADPHGIMNPGKLVDQR